jgi:hypothetical protein
MKCTILGRVIQMEKMEKSLEATKRAFGSVRTGRANPSMLDRIEASTTLLMCCLASSLVSAKNHPVKHLEMAN